MESEKYPYQNEWETYRATNSLGCLLLPVIILLILLLRYFSPQLPNYFGGVLFIVFFAILIAYLLFGKGEWKCPRCREDYDRLSRVLPTKKCIHCSLPRYYGSTYFSDYWGNEKAQELDEEVKESK